MMRANVERIYDEYEREAVKAIIRENAHRSKKPQAGDLFKRPLNALEAESRTEELLEKAIHATEWLSQFEQFGGKEDANG